MGGILEVGDLYVREANREMVTALMFMKQIVKMWFALGWDSSPVT
jgi:hypothetical protein